ncbi:MAG: hypothetical protein MHPSP_000573 [Paramarteilia canceri]
MVENGMRIARLNFSHGDYKYHSETIKLLEEVRKSTGKNFAIALDTKGPEIRTGDIAEGKNSVEIKTGSSVVLSNDKNKFSNCTSSFIYCDYPGLLKLEPGERIFIEDGLFQFVIEKKNSDHLVCVAKNSGELGSRKGVNLPDSDVDLPAMTEKDKSDLKFGVEQKVDMIFASFIRSKDHVLEMKKYLKECGDENNEILIIPKIENKQGINNYCEILEVSDGIMAARGDLGIETPLYAVPIMQKYMNVHCLKAKKPFIVATQMLESMIKNPRATRAEVSDIANAVLDGASCVMLSGESAKGSYPVESVKTQASVAKNIETHIDAMRTSCLNSSDNKFESHPAENLRRKIGSRLIIAFESENSKDKNPSIFGYLGECPIVFCSKNGRKARQANLVRGMIPFEVCLEGSSDGHKDMCSSWSKMIKDAVKLAKSYTNIEYSKDEKIVVISGCPGSYSISTTTLGSIDSKK